MASTLAPQVWISAVDPIVAAATGSTGSADYMSLFSSDANWPVTTAGTRVFKISTQFAANASDSDLATVINFLKQHHIMLALEGLMIPSGPGGIGNNVEGYSAPGTMAAVAQRIARLGGDLSYVAMDEPLYYGHQYAGANAAEESILQVAQQVATSVAAIRTVFPNVKVGDIEPVPETKDINQWAVAFHQATGQRLAFMDADVQWGPGWQPNLDIFAKGLVQARVPLGVIYNGAATDPSAADWEATAVQRFSEIETDPLLRPVQAIIQTWTAQPGDLAPENSLGTLTNLALTYLSGATLLREATGSAAAAAVSPPELARAWAATGTTVSAQDLGLRLIPAPSGSSNYTVVLAGESGTFVGDQVDSGSGQVAGEGSGTLILSGDFEQVSDELASVRYTEAGVGADEIGMFSFNSGGQSAEVFTGITLGSLLPITPPPGMTIAELYQNIGGVGAPPADTQVSSLLTEAQLEIAAIYEQVHSRDPDPSGLVGWATALVNGTPLATIRSDFATSAESVNVINAAYEGVYGGAASPQAMAAAEVSLASGVPLNVVSAPWLADAEQQVTSLYEQVQGRQPDAGGLNSWSEWMVAGHSQSSIRTIFATSAESADRLGNLVGEAVGAPASQTVLGGLEAWLASGMSIQQLSPLVQELGAQSELASFASEPTLSSSDGMTFIVASHPGQGLRGTSAADDFVIPAPFAGRIVISGFDIKQDFLTLPDFPTAPSGSPQSSGMYDDDIVASPHGALIHLSATSSVLISGVPPVDIPASVFVS